MSKKLGKIEKIPLREIWNNEANDFTPWLAEQDNLCMLGETIGLSLVEPEQEVPVGCYSCDISCKIENDDRIAVIENQIEQSDHDHLGKSIVYASGLGASIVIWIVKNARPEHASAIEWLNEHTDGNVGFFLVEIQAIKIGDSEPAPQFNIVAKPNDYAKAVKSNSGNKEPNRIQLGRYNFWTQLNDFIESNSYKLKTRKPTYDHWYAFALGSSKYHLTVTLLDKYKQIGVGLWIFDDKTIFNKLSENKDKIASAIYFPIKWDEKAGKKASEINSRIDNFSFDNNKNYADLDREICRRLIAFEEALKPFLKIGKEE